MARHLTLLTDLYELTMMQGYFKNNNNHTVVFDMFYRNNPFGGGYSVCCGIDQLVDYVKNLSFSEDDIEYLRSTKIFDDDFIESLRDFKFTGDIYSVPEGTVIFPREPIIKVIAPITEAQLIEPALLNIINHQCLIATKASRIYNASKGAPVMEFGLRRAQAPDAAIYGARAAVIAGCIGTSNVLSGKMFDIPVLGTHAHSWIMSFASEYEAFKAYADIYPDNCTLLVDTYNTLRSGVPNAIKIFSEMRSKGIHPKNYGIRIDSGDLAYLTKKARVMLDEAGFTDAKITASGDLDEFLIQSLLEQGAKIDSWGIGTKMITADGNPSFGGVYKLAAIEDENGEYTPKIKISDNTAKITNPGNKVVYRVFDNNDMIVADLIALENEIYNESEDLLLFDPTETWKQTLLRGGQYHLKPLLEPIFVKGKCLYKKRSTFEVREFCLDQLNHLWEENKRLINPNNVFVDLSEPLYELKQSLLNKHSEDKLKYN